MNKNYDWNETNNSVTITFPLLYKIDKKKFDYTITDSYIKLNLYQMKQFHFIDLKEEIDIDTSQIILEENKIIFNLVKKENKLWKKLESDLTKEELKERRKKANERLEENIKQKRELAENKKKEFEKFVVDKSIKIDDNFREELRNKKQEEKTMAEIDLYKFVDRIDNNKTTEEKNDDEDDNIVNEENIKNNANINQKIEEEKNNEEINEDDNIKTTENENKNKHILEQDPYENEKEPETEVKPIKHNIESRRNQIFFDEEKEKSKKGKEDKEQPLKIESPMVASTNFQNTIKALLDKKDRDIEKEKQKSNESNAQAPNIRKQETIKVNLTK